MSKKNDGGPAFPRPIGTYKVNNVVNYSEAQGGMSLRAFYAGQAMEAMVTASTIIVMALGSLIESARDMPGVDIRPMQKTIESITPEFIAREAVTQADALLEALKK